MVVRLRVLGSRVKVTGDVPVEIHQKLDALMQFKPEGIEYSDKVKADEWDGIIHLYGNREFPVGLLERVEMLFMLNDIQYEVVDTREDLGGRNPIKTTIVLRDYQERIVKDAIRQKSGLIPVPTGGGKTLMAAEIIARIGLPSALFIVPTVEILHQSVDVFRRFLKCSVGWIGDNGEEQGPDDRILVITWQTISSGLRKKETRPKWRDFLAQYSLVIADEVHHYSAENLFEVAMYCNSRYRYGLSGTMFRADASEIKFYAAFGECIKGITASELIDLKYLVPPKIRFVGTKPMMFGRRETWQEVYKDAVIENGYRNEQVVTEAVRLANRGRRTLVLVTQIRHGQILKHMIEDRLRDYPDIRFAFVYSTAKERPDIVEGFRKGEINLLVATQIFDEGVDVPEIEAIVLAGAGKSQVKAVQRVGRGLRICPEIKKEDVEIVDFCDSCKYLWDHSHERYEIYRREPKFVITGDVPK